MKRALFTKKQKEIIEESLAIQSSMLALPAHLVEDLDANKAPFDSKEYDIKKLAAIRFNEVTKEFTDDITQYSDAQITNKLNKLVTACIEKERNIRPQLEKICLNALIEAFKIPDDGISIDAELCDEISNSTQFHITPDTDENYEYDSVSDMKNEDSEVTKRKIIDAVIVGGAMRMAEIVKKKVFEKVFELDEELPHLYSRIVKINDFLIFTKKFVIKDGSHKQGGYVEVRIGNDITPTTITAKAVIFPILLIEAIRGCMEVWAAHGLPDDRRTAMATLNRADVLEDEPWYNRLGPVIWDRICDTTDFERLKYMPMFINKLASCNTDGFIEFFGEIVAGTKVGKATAANIMDVATHDEDYSSFEYDLKQKQTDKGVIEDGYFTEEELEEAAYPSNFNIEEFKNIPNFKDRIKYCGERLQKIGSGSSRIVYKIDENTVLKLAKNKKGIAQNEKEAECGRDYYLRGLELFAETYDFDKNGLWIEMQYARVAKPSDFKRITGFDFEFIQQWIDYCYSSYQNRYNARYNYISPENMELFNDSNFWDEIEYTTLSSINDYLSNYQVEMTGDLKKMSSWGVTNDDRLVIIDFGIDEEIYNAYYRKSLE